MVLVVSHICSVLTAQVLEIRVLERVWNPSKYEREFGSMIHTVHRFIQRTVAILCFPPLQLKSVSLRGRIKKPVQLNITPSICVS